VAHAHADFSQASFKMPFPNLNFMDEGLFLKFSDFFAT